MIYIFWVLDQTLTQFTDCKVSVCLLIQKICMSSLSFNKKYREMRATTIPKIVKEPSKDKQL